MNSQMQDCRYVPVRVDGQLYCFDNQVIRSVALGSDCELFEESLPGGIAGEANYAGAEIPVLRLRSLLQSSSNTPMPNREHLVVTQTDQGYCGFLVDDVYRAREFAPQDLQPLPEPATNSEHPFFEGIARLSEYATSDDATQVESTKDVSQSGALILSLHGLLGQPSSPTTEFELPQVDVGALLADGKRQHGQLMLFDVPHKTLDDKRVSIGFSVSEVLEVVQASDLLSVPGAADFFFGLLPWRNQFVPVVDVTQLLDLGTLPEESQQRIAIVRSSNNRLVGFYSSTHIRTVRMPIDADAYEIRNVTDLPIVSGSFLTSEDEVLVLPKSLHLVSSELRLPELAV